MMGTVCTARSCLPDCLMASGLVCSPHGVLRDRKNFPELNSNPLTPRIDTRRLMERIGLPIKGVPGGAKVLLNG